MFPLPGFDGPDIHALGAERGGAGGRRGVGERVVAVRGERDVGEPGGRDQGVKLSCQESTGNSAGPQSNVLFCPVRDRLADDDVGNLQASPRFEHAVGLG